METILLTFATFLTFVFHESFLLNTRKPFFKIFLFTLLSFMGIYLPTPIRLFYFFCLLYLLFLPNDTKKFLFAFLVSNLVMCFLEIICVLFFLKVPYLGYLSLLFSYLLIHTKPFLSFWKLLQNKKNIDFFIIFSLFLFSVFFFTEFQNWLLPIFWIFFFVFVFIFFKEREKNEQLKDAYHQMEEYTKLCEKYMEDFRIEQHENKNFLLSLRGMISKDKQALAFINQLLQEQESISFELVKEVEKIPYVFLRGLFYAKLKFCQEHEIVTHFEIDPMIRKTKKESKEFEHNLARILGVFFDNAIEATEKTKNKNINIYIYYDNQKLNFQIANTFDDTIHLNFLGKPGYSTKGKGHGYGLSLVKKIVKNEKRFHMETMICDDVFTQTLSIMKKN